MREELQTRGQPNSYTRQGQKVVGYLVGLFAILVLGLTLKAICAVHLFSLVVPAVYIHVFGVKPCATGSVWIVHTRI